jgi:FixJ family two-component response regulator
MMATDGRVFIVDDEPSVRRALRVVVESAGFEADAFASAEDFIALYQPATHGCLLLDLRLGGMSGLQLLDLLRQRNIRIPTLMISGHGDIRTAVQSIKLGAVDFLEKPLDRGQLIEKIRDILRLAGSQSIQKETRRPAGAPMAALTPRELEIMQQLIAGKSSKQIAADLCVAYRTICNHRAHLLAKTGANNTAALVRMAIAAGMSGDL